MTMRVKRLLVETARERAAKNGLPFDISVETLHWPAVCPALGIPIRYANQSQPHDNRPSLDQHVPRGGYTVANTRVISKRANQVKGNATAQELFLVAKYIAAESGLQPFVADGTLSTSNPIGDPNMSENARAIALQHAVAVSKTPAEALATAHSFHSFLTGGAADAPAPTGAAAGKAATGAAAGKAATKTAGKAATPEDKAAAALKTQNAAAAAAQDAGEDGAAAKTAAGAAIKALINANLRDECKALLEEFEAVALSSLKPEDYEVFTEKANELLMAS
jgi:hypothetical protein